MKIRKGTSIIEIVVATALISVSILAALSLTTRSKQQNTYAREVSQATKYATQAADWIRSERTNLGWATLADTGSGSYCLNNFPADFTSISAGSCSQSDYIPGTIFTRYIEVDTTSINSGVLRIVVYVDWLDKTTHQTKLNLELTSWY